SLPGISATAHFAGGAAGLVTSVLLNVQRFGSRPQRWLAVVGLALIPAFCLAPLMRQTAPPLAAPPAAPSRRGLALTAKAGTPVELRQLEQAAWKVYQTEVEPLVKRPPAERTQAEVEKALEEMSRQWLATDRAAKVLQSTPPLSDRGDEAERQAAAKLLAAES